MSDVPGLPGEESPDDFPPIPALRDLDMPVSENFLETVRRKIERRSTANHFLNLFWYAPAMLLLEFAAMVLEIVAPTPPNGGSK